MSNIKENRKKNSPSSSWGGVGDHDDEKPPPPPLNLPSRDYLADMFKSSNLDSSRSNSPRSRCHAPKVQSNLVKSGGDARGAVTAMGRDQLVEWVGERERQLTSVKTEYEKNFDAYKKLVTKFYTEKLNNLKLTFKNQILKQKIYFETEILELCREYWNDFEQQMTKTTTTSVTPNSKKTSKTKESKNKHLIKMLNNDLKTLLDYMRESLINSSDTLIEAYETCECLKRLQNTDASVNRQYLVLKQSTERLLSGKSNEKEAEPPVQDDEQAMIQKYKSDLDDLMNTLDDIELAHLQRKEALGGCCKLANKLKSKFKFVESKYETLSRQVAALKFESYVYRELWMERQRTSGEDSLAAASTSSASRSTSTSSLAEECDIGAFSASTSSASSSSSMMSNNDENLLHMDEFEIFDSNSSDDDSSESSNENVREREEPKPSDYHRKLALITDLISLHKSKSSRSISASSGGEMWGVSSSLPVSSCEPDNDQSASVWSPLRRPFNRRHVSSSLGLIECSCEGDRVGVENCDLKRDCDITGWLLERCVDGVGETAEYTIPAGTVIKSGKVLRLDEPFGSRAHRHVEELLTAIKINDAAHSRLTVTTRLLAPDRTVMASHTQQIPHFYREIFKYANLIRFL